MGDHRNFNNFTGKRNMKKVSIFTGCHCISNPGAGGWCAILQSSKHRKAISGGGPDTTNMRMYLTATVEGILALKEPCDVTIYCRSEYPEGAIALHWKIRNNRDVLSQLFNAKHNHEIKFIGPPTCWGESELTAADKIAQEEARKQSKG